MTAWGQTRPSQFYARTSASANCGHFTALAVGSDVPFRDSCIAARLSIRLLRRRVASVGRQPPERPAAIAYLADRRRSDARVWNVRILVVARLRLVAEPGEPGPIDTYELALALHHLASDQDRVDVLRPHAGHHRADRVVHRHDVEHVSAQQDDVCLLTGSERADLALELVGTCAFDGGEFEHLAGSEELRRVLVTGKPSCPDLVLLQREHGAHLREEVVRDRGLDVDAQ